MARTDTITDLAYAQITGDYYWAHYGPFDLIMNKKTGYVNADHLCSLARPRRKAFVDWLTDPYNSPDELFDCIAADQQIAREEIMIEPADLPYEVRGCYIHSILVPLVAMWVMPAFAVSTHRAIANSLAIGPTEATK